MASELHPRVTLLEGYNKGGPVNHGLQFLPGFILEKERKTADLCNLFVIKNIVMQMINSETLINL